MAEANLEEIRGQVIELESRVWDLERRVTNLESLLGTLISPFPFGRSSRWVLELFPDEIEEWRRALRTIPTERLTERERSFLASMDYYIVSERKVTLPQLIWLTVIKRKAGGILPEIPLVTAPKIETHSQSSRHSNPNVQRGVPKTDIERVMAHYGLSREEAERLIEDVMRVYGVRREEAIKALLPPRGAKVKATSPYSNPYAECSSCGYTWSPPPNYCPRCLTILKG